MNTKTKQRPTAATGPKTASGKARSSQNAVTHGLRATKIDNPVSPTLRAEYEKLRLGIRDIHDK